MGWILLILFGVVLLFFFRFFLFGGHTKKLDEKSEDKELYPEKKSPECIFDDPEKQIVKFAIADVSNDNKKVIENSDTESPNEELVKQYNNILESFRWPTDDHLDPLFNDAVRLVILSQNVSSHVLQRKFGVGYNRVCRIIDQLEAAGIISSLNHNHVREVLVKDEVALKQLLSRRKQNNEVGKDHVEELSKLIGLANVKKEINDLYNLVKVQKMRESNGMKVSDISYHCVFTGNPGTGKTTVARIVAGIYKELGVIKKGHLVETDRSGMVGEYVGQTAPKTNAIIDSALDGVLFIDEAYSLTQGGQNDFGMEAISTLLKRMEDDRNRLVVILAGYTKEMEDCIKANSGLQSRFNHFIEFPDYTSEELMQIFNFIAKKNDYIISEGANSKIALIIDDAVKHKDEYFGNARYVRNLFEKIITQQANRISYGTKITNEMLAMIEEADVINASC